VRVALADSGADARCPDTSIAGSDNVCALAALRPAVPTTMAIGAATRFFLLIPRPLM